MSYQPPYPPGPPAGRSTPIPGSGGALTPSEFLGSTPTTTDIPGSGPPPTPTPFPYGRPPQPPRKKSFNWGFWIMTVIIVGSTLLGIGAAVWGVIKANDAVDHANQAADDAVDIADEYTDPQLSDNDRAALSLTTEQYLWEGAAMYQLVAAFDNGIIGSPTMFTEVDFYSDYGFAVAQNPQLPDHLDRYSWRVGQIDAPDPESNDADAPSKVFSINDMDWAVLATVVQQAPGMLNVEQGEIIYVSVSRDMFQDGAPVVGRIYVSGPRSSGFVEVGADGTVLRTS